MRRASVILSLLVLLIGGLGTAAAPAASADAVILCEVVGNAVPPAEDDCEATMEFIDDTYDRQADNVFWVFCTVFPEHPACQ
jgi:hypothetical protein